MKSIGMAAAALALSLGMTLGAGLAPKAVGEAVAAAREDRAAARTARRLKRVECRKEADAQKLRFIKRSQFMRTCNRHR